MNIGKTIICSVLLHLVFFSAALLFSAGLLKGRENITDPQVIYVKLTDDSKDERVQEKVIQKPAKKQNQQLIQKKPEPVITARTAKKVEINEEIAAPVQEEAVDTDSSPVNQETESTSPVINQMDAADSTTDVKTAHTIPDRTAAADTSKPEGPAGFYPRIIEIIGRAIERVKTYPLLARKRGIEGTVYVSFGIDTGGMPEGIKILKSSGHSILDKATIRVVRKAAPYPHVKNRVEVPVAYKLRSKG